MDKQKTTNGRDYTDTSQLVATVSDFSENAVEKSRVAMEKSVELAREYPLHTAIGAGVLGFLAGLVTHKILK